MQKVITASAELWEKVSRTPNATLSVSGWRLKQQADAGFGPANRFTESASAKEIRQRASSARIRSIWKRVGMPPPPNRWDGRAGKLIDTMIRLQEMIADAPDELERCWLELTRNDEDLSGIPASLYDVSCSSAKPRERRHR
jgi:hypothetical protein